jgi:hypothetical protein
MNEYVFVWGRELDRTSGAKLRRLYEANVRLEVVTRLFRILYTSYPGEAIFYATPIQEMTLEFR